MSRNLSVTEPHPTVPKTGGYIGGGRGGAGNYKRYKATDVSSGPNASGPASRVSLIKSAQRAIPAGRGGAGNMISVRNDEDIFQFDEEMVKKRENQAPVYHIGRGGAGNLCVDNRKPASSRKDSNASSSSESDRSAAIQRRNSGVLSVFGRWSS